MASRRIDGVLLNASLTIARPFNRPGLYWLCLFILYVVSGSWLCRFIGHDPMIRGWCWRCDREFPRSGPEHRKE